MHAKHIRNHRSRDDIRFDTGRLAWTHVEIESRHRVGRYGVDVDALDEIAERALALDDTADVYLVDEIGKMECFSGSFRSAMRMLLDSGRPVVAT